MTNDPQKESKSVANDFIAAAKYLKNETTRLKRLCRQEEMMLLPAQAAAMLGITPQAVESRIKEGSLRSFHVLGRIFVSGKEVDEIMNERIKRLLAAGEDKSKLEEKLLKKMSANVKVMKRKQQAGKTRS